MTEMTTDEAIAVFESLTSEDFAQAVSASACRMVAVVWGEKASAALRHLISEARKAERLTEALTPSGGTKAEYIGEFTTPRETVLGTADDDVYTEQIPVTWTTTKEIMKAIMARAERSAPDTEGGANE